MFLVKRPGVRGRPEALDHFGSKLCGKRRDSMSAVRVDTVVGEGCQSLRLHPTFRRQPLHKIDVPLTPHALRLPGCEADRVALIVTRLSASVDPAVAERFVDGVFPGDRALPHALLVVPRPEWSADAWCSSIQARKSAASGKNVGAINLIFRALTLGSSALWRFLTLPARKYRALQPLLALYPIRVEQRKWRGR